MHKISKWMTQWSLGHEIVLDISSCPLKYASPLLNLIAKHTYTFTSYQTRKGYQCFGKKQKTQETRGSQVTRGSQGVQKQIWVYDDSKRRPYIKDLLDAIDHADVARDLENEPSNVMTPKRFVKFAKELFKESRIEIKVLDEKQIVEEGLLLVDSVGRSSSNPHRFLIAEWIHDPSRPTICLIGKGVTFDAGGLRLKPIASLMSMKQDKSGASIVLAIMNYLITCCPDLPVNVVALMPMVENVINGRATKPGDVFQSHDGRNVEVVDPDAEGRLIIADAISYSSRYHPDYIIDFATLTNTASTVCCDLSAVYFAKDDGIAKIVDVLGEALGERVWRLPPWTEYRAYTKSSVADVRNANFECTKGGSFMPSMFICNFVPEKLHRRWIHFDISNNDIGGTHTANAALLGMNVVKTLAITGKKLSREI